MRGVAVALGLVLGCAPARPLAYEQNLAAGDRAFSSGRYREAARFYEAAGAATARARDRDQGAFLAAMALVRAGDRDAAIARLDDLGARSPTWEHGPRAAYEAATLRAESDDPALRDEGFRRLDALVRSDPRTGPARRAVSLIAHRLDSEDPSFARTLAWLTTLRALDAVRGCWMYETVEAMRAVRLTRRGALAEAEAVWRALLAAVPYPQNSHWDDGHLALARLERQRGDARAAVATLDRMLAPHEEAYSSGSYEAPRFADGAMLRAEIYRDDLRDPEAAASAFHRVYAEFRRSLLRDNALAEEARVREGARDPRACEVWQRLVEEFPCGHPARQAREGLGRCGRTAAPRDDAACRAR